MIAEDHKDFVLLEREGLVPELHCVQHVSSGRCIVEITVRERIEVVDVAGFDARPVEAMEEGETLTS